MTSHGRLLLREGRVGNAAFAEQKATFVDLPSVVNGVGATPGELHADHEINLPTFLLRNAETQAAKGRVGNTRHL